MSAPVWLAVLIPSVLTVSGFVAGWAVGRRSAVQRQVDAVLRRETRFRHPAGQGAAPGPLLLAPSAEEAAAALGARWPTLSRRMLTVGEWACGKPVMPAVGDVPTPCLKSPGHKGACW